MNSSFFNSDDYSYYDLSNHQLLSSNNILYNDNFDYLNLEQNNVVASTLSDTYIENESMGNENIENEITEKNISQEKKRKRRHTDVSGYNKELLKGVTVSAIEQFKIVATPKEKLLFKFLSERNYTIVPNSDEDKTLVRFTNKCYRLFLDNLEKNVYGGTEEFIRHFKLEMNLPDDYKIIPVQLHKAAHSYRKYNKVPKIKNKNEELCNDVEDVDYTTDIVSLEDFNEKLQFSSNKKEFLLKNKIILKRYIDKVEKSKFEELKKYPLLVQEFSGDNFMDIIVNGPIETLVSNIFESFQKIKKFIPSSTPYHCLVGLHKHFKMKNDGDDIVLKYDFNLNVINEERDICLKTVDYKMRNVELLYDNGLEEFGVLVDGNVVGRSNDFFRVMVAYYECLKFFNYGLKYRTTHSIIICLGSYDCKGLDCMLTSSKVKKAVAYIQNL